MSNAVKNFSVALVAMLTLVVPGASPALAQGVGGAQGGADESHEGIGIGIKGGWLFSNLTAESVEFDRRTGQQIGVFFGGNRPGLVGVMAEVNYGKKGANIQVLDENYDVRFVSVPVVVRVNGGSRSLSGVSGYGIVGPQFDWIISQKIGDVDISEDTEGYELSLVAGAGIEITRFIVELRYIHGLRSISKEFNLGNTDELKSKAFGILFGFRFN